MTFPLSRGTQVPVPAVAAGSDGTYAVFVAPAAGTVTQVTYTPNSAITGADTNTRTVAVVNTKQDGTGSTSVASLALANGVNAAADDEKVITLSGTAANLVLAAGDVLKWTSTHAASGLADPGGLVRVYFSTSGT